VSTAPAPLDEFPIHQTQASLRHVATSDRNFYDRAYLNAHDRTGDVFCVAGLGVYPNLGVIDAYVTVRKKDRQWVVRASDALDAPGLDRLTPHVGPIRIEVIEPLEKLRLVCEDEAPGLACDLTFTGSFPAVMEQPHVMRSGTRPIIAASRFAQVGTWSGTLTVDGEELPVTDDTWVGTRDRSWGIRPSGEPDPTDRWSSDEPIEGFWWMYVPMRFDDFALIVIAQELPDGFRVLNDASRVFTDGRREQLGWPDVVIDYASGTRHPTGARISLTPRASAPFTVEIDTLGFVPLNVGAGYTGDPDWNHGQWRGRGWVDRSTYDLADPAIVSRIPFSVVDHVARARIGDDEGWGLFEHGTFGRHDPSGFSDWGSLAP
jgi:hypothetical protein